MCACVRDCARKGKIIKNKIGKTAFCRLIFSFSCYNACVRKQQVLIRCICMQVLPATTLLLSYFLYFCHVALSEAKCWTSEYLFISISCSIFEAYQLLLFL